MDTRFGNEMTNLNLLHIGFDPNTTIIQTATIN